MALILNINILKVMALILKTECVLETWIALVFQLKRKQPKQKQTPKPKSFKGNTSEVNYSVSTFWGISILNMRKAGFTISCVSVMNRKNKTPLNDACRKLTSASRTDTGLKWWDGKRYSLQMETEREQG